MFNAVAEFFQKILLAGASTSGYLARLVCPGRTTGKSSKATPGTPFRVRAGEAFTLRAPLRAYGYTNAVPYKTQIQSGRNSRPQHVFTIKANPWILGIPRGKNVGKARRTLATCPHWAAFLTSCRRETAELPRRQGARPRPPGAVF